MSTQEWKKAIAELKLEPEHLNEQQLKAEIVEAKKDRHLFLNATDYKNHRRYREALFSRTYIPILLEIFEGQCISTVQIETDIGICFQLNLTGGGKVYDYGSQIKVGNGTEEEIRVAIKLAMEKGWGGLHLTGSEAFKEQAFLEAVLSGAFRPEQITGYKPSKANLEVIRDYKPAFKIVNDSSVIASYAVDRSGSGIGGGGEQVHVPKLKI